MMTPKPFEIGNNDMIKWLVIKTNYVIKWLYVVFR